MRSRSPSANEEAAAGARELVEQYAPAEYRQDALAVLNDMTAGSEIHEVDRSSGETAAGYLAFAATAGWLCTRPGPFPSRETVRLELIQQIRTNEAAALRVPERERVTTVADRPALAFLNSLFDDGFPLPADRHERGVWELDIIAVIQHHLLETPADATTPEQREALKKRILDILKAAAGTPQRTPPPDRSTAVRNQPKRKKPKKRR